ncbi:MAG: hypothetical protein CMJ73_04570 [Planctomycetaceae bacterium]|nr:hypothetical protein [Planctomycetaceae bacterium]
MSLFENAEYRWRETFLVLFASEDRPSTKDFKKAISALGDRYSVDSLVENDQLQLESLTLLAPLDNAAMDISFIEGEEVAEQLEQMREQISEEDLLPGEDEKLARLAHCNARYDILHFEHVQDFLAEEDDEFMDPGGLLIVAEVICGLCQGVAVDPQSGTFV